MACIHVVLHIVMKQVLVAILAIGRGLRCFLKLQQLQNNDVFQRSRNNQRVAFAKRACVKAVATLKCNVDALGEMINIFSPFNYIAVS